MDTEVLTSVEQIQKEVSEIRKLGKRWGFEDEEIDAYITEALESSNQPPVTKKKAPKGKCRKYFGYAAKIVMAFWIVVLSVSVILGFVDEKRLMPVMKHVVDLSYPLLRYTRLFGIRLHHISNFSEYYNSECLIDNPWYDNSPDSCWHCRNLKKLSDVPSTRKLVWKYEMEAVIFREALANATDFSTLRKMYKEKRDLLEPELHSTTISANRPNYRSLIDIFEDEKVEDEILKDRGFSFVCILWRSNSAERNSAASLAVNQILRNVFGRPRFISSQSEVSPEKGVLIQGPTDEPFDLPPLPNPFGWYVQLGGTRRIRVSPSPKCTQQCQEYEVVLHPQDAIVFMTYNWNVKLLPYDGDYISLGYSGHFN